MIRFQPSLDKTLITAIEKSDAISMRLIYKEELPREIAKAEREGKGWEITHIPHASLERLSLTTATTAILHLIDITEGAEKELNITQKGILYDIALVMTGGSNPYTILHIRMDKASTKLLKQRFKDQLTTKGGI